jgi:hypothetical protein
MARLNLPIEANRGFDFCFSPNGGSVAALTGGFVRIFDPPK